MSEMYETLLIQRWGFYTGHQEPIQICLFIKQPTWFLKNIYVHLHCRESQVSTYPYYKTELVKIKKQIKRSYSLSIHSICVTEFITSLFGTLAKRSLFTLPRSPIHAVSHSFQSHTHVKKKKPHIPSSLSLSLSEAPLQTQAWAYIPKQRAFKTES